MKQLLAFGLFLSLAAPLAAADVDGLLQQLRTGDSEARRNAAKALGQSGAEAKSALPALVQALRDNDRFVRRYAAEALGKIDGEPQVRVAALAAALRDPTKEVQQAAVISLGSVGVGAVPALVGAMTDSNLDSGVRGRAAEALGKLGPAGHAAIPQLIAAVEANGGRPGKKKGPASGGDIRFEAVNALGDIATAEDKNAVSALRSLAGDKKVRDRTLKQAANQAARRIEARKPS